MDSRILTRQFGNLKRTLLGRAGGFVLITSAVVLVFSLSMITSGTRFFPMPATLLAASLDLDAIEDDIDGEFIDGAFVDQSNFFSDKFTDQHLGGTTFGQGSSGFLTISDAIDPADGILVEISEPSDRFETVSHCLWPTPEFSQSTINDNDSYIFTCGSTSELKVLSGPIAIRRDTNAVLLVDTGAAVSLETLVQPCGTCFNNVFEISNTASSSGNVHIYFESIIGNFDVRTDDWQSAKGVIVVIPPDTTGLITRIENHAYRVDNSPDSQGVMSIDFPDLSSENIVPGSFKFVNTIAITSSPLPVPSASGWALAALAVVFGVILTFRIRKSYDSSVV